MKKNLSVFLVTALFLGLSSCGRVTVFSGSEKTGSDRFESRQADTRQNGPAWSGSESLGDQQEPNYRPQVTPAQEERATGEASGTNAQAARSNLATSGQTGQTAQNERAKLAIVQTAQAEPATERMERETESSERSANKWKRQRVQRISRKDPFGERYAEANQFSVGVHNAQAGSQRSALSASSIMEAAPAAAFAQARQRYDFDDPLYLALFIILVVLALLLAILIIAETISALGLIGVLLLAGLIIALVILL